MTDADMPAIGSANWPRTNIFRCDVTRFEVGLSAHSTFKKRPHNFGDFISKFLMKA